MKTKTIKVHGKYKQMVYPITDQDFKNQVHEIHNMEHYLSGLLHIKERYKDPNKKAVVMDLGANIGNTSLFYAPFVKQVHSFEPNPLIFEALAKNTTKEKNIAIHNYGVSYKNTTFSMHSKEKNDPPQTLYLDKPEHSQAAEFKTIDTIFEECKIDHVDVLKADIEGSEYVLFCSSGFAKVADKIDTIIGEAHYMSQNSASPDFIPLILADYGFKTEFLDFKPPNYVRFLNYEDPVTKEKKTWKKQENTIFWAYK